MPNKHNRTALDNSTFGKQGEFLFAFRNPSSSPPSMWPVYGSWNVLVEMKMDKVNNTEACFYYKTHILPLDHLKLLSLHLFSFHI